MGFRELNEQYENMREREYQQGRKEMWAKSKSFDRMADNLEEELRLLGIAWRLFRSDPKLTNDERLRALSTRVGWVYEMVEEIIEGKKYA